jgi:hypothetical protein
MSEDDKRTYRQLLLIAVLAIFAILFLFALGALYAEHACIQLYLMQANDIPESCGGIGKFVLELAALVIGTLGAIKLLGQ